ncbi:MAG TPA: transcriptional regulator [Caulobacteraceae bacterium]
MKDYSFLLPLMGGAYTPGGGFAGLGGAKPAPTAPWEKAAGPAPEPSALVRAAMAGRQLIDEDAARLDVKGASQDYRRLFALYQGLTSLNALVGRADTKGLTAGEAVRVDAAFARGLAEVSSYLSTAQFEALDVVRNTTAGLARATVGVKRDQQTYVTGPVHEGSAESPVAAFAGPVQFSISVKKTGGAVVGVDIDLAEMGATARTLGAVTAFINGKLEAAGIQTRLGRDKLPAEPRTLQVGGKTVTLPAGLDRWALAVRGVSTETVSFGAPQAADAVYVTQIAGIGTAARAQMLKFQADTGTGAPPPAEAGVGETLWVQDRVFQADMGPQVAAVRATAAGADGSVYTLADVTGTVDGQVIKGARDVALIKYDSAGKVVFTRTLGAAESASGMALAVSADGKVAIAGSVTGALDKGVTGHDAAVSDSFVTVFDASGDELWTQRRGARAADEASAVAFGADGSVYVAGRAQSAMTGAAPVGGWDSYLQGFSATGAATFARQFGSSGEDAATAIAVDGSSVYVAGIEDGQGKVRRFELQATGGPLQTASRDLGVLSGSISAIAVSGGQLVVAGTSRNAALGGAAVTTAASGGSDAFVAALSTDLVASAADRVSYYGGTGTDTATGMAVVDGKVWLTGRRDVTVDQDKNALGQGYLVRLNPLTGAVEYQRTFAGAGDAAAPTGIAVVRDGASVLDRLGLPKGEIDKSDSKTLVSATSLRVGDQFTVRADGGRTVTVTIDARDTLKSLANKITVAAGSRVKVTIAKVDDRDMLSITPRDERSDVEIGSGTAGRDALEALGISAAYLRTTATEGDERSPVYGLKLGNDLHLRDKAGIKAAGTAVQDALTAIRKAYRELVAAGQPAASRATGPVPAYLTAQMANYQAALSRLGG